MRLHVLAEVEVKEYEVGVLRQKLAGFGAYLNENTYGGDVFGLNYCIEYNGDHEVGISVMDIIESYKFHYLVAYLADSHGITELLKKQD